MVPEAKKEAKLQIETEVVKAAVTVARSGQASSVGHYLPLMDVVSSSAAED